MSPLQFLASLVFLAVCAFALTCNNGGGGLSAPLSNKTCLSNVTSCWRTDVDSPNGTILTSWYDCDTGGACKNYPPVANVSLTNGTIGFLYCCNTNYCNFRRSAFDLSILPAISATIAFFSLRG